MSLLAMTLNSFGAFLISLICAGILYGAERFLHLAAALYTSQIASFEHYGGPPGPP